MKPTIHPYYALIPAESKEKAIEMYVNEICEDDDNCLQEEMNEIKQITAFIKFIKAAEEELTTIGTALDEFYNAHILLVDNDLV